MTHLASSHLMQASHYYKQAIQFKFFIFSLILSLALGNDLYHNTFV
jgi:hypothetical protein